MFHTNNSYRKKKHKEHIHTTKREGEGTGNLASRTTTSTYYYHYYTYIRFRISKSRVMIENTCSIYLNVEKERGKYTINKVEFISTHQQQQQMF